MIYHIHTYEPSLCKTGFTTQPAAPLCSTLVCVFVRQIYPNSSSLIWRLQHKRCEAVTDMAQSRLLVVAALLGLQAGALAEDTPAPSSIAPTVSPQTITPSPTITLSPTAYTPPNNEDDIASDSERLRSHRRRARGLAPRRRPDRGREKYLILGRAGRRQVHCIELCGNQIVAARLHHC